jgi:cation diffusion facilitator family transporter
MVAVMSATERVPRAAERAAVSRRTVLVALGANLVVASAKLVGTVVSGSNALLAEAGHSFADCLHELFLLVGLARGGREPTRLHPLGFGRERFFWSLLAAVAIFITGSVVAISEGDVERLADAIRVESSASGAPEEEKRERCIVSASSAVGERRRLPACP